MIELAKKICKEAHSEQYDKGGKEYYLHPFTVAEMCVSEDEKIVAYLHDVIEDNKNYSIEYLREQGFAENILIALDNLTHRKDESYKDYIERLKVNPLARAVKINDLQHNMDLTRLSNITQKDLDRVEKYKYYLAYLKDAK